MAIYFITRHLGAIQWADANHIDYDEHLTHLDNMSRLKAGDVVIGTLPINIVYELNQLGVRYKHLSLNIPPHLRGVELDVEALKACNAHIKEYAVTQK